MLKIEKSKKTHEINIRLRHPLRLFDRCFLLALTAAVGVHLFAALLFHVRLFTLGEIETTLPPTRALAHFVKSSAEEGDAIVSAQINREGRLTPTQLAPPGSIPQLSRLPPPQMISALETPKNLQINPFLEIEKDSEETIFTLLELPIIAPPIKLTVAGPLAEIPLQTLGEEMAKLFELQKFSAKNFRQEQIVYAVEVDFQSGKIFWYQPVETSLDQFKNNLAERILRELVFQTKESEDFVQSGQVEIIFTESSV